jgi:hypothetical protein
MGHLTFFDPDYRTILTGNFTDLLNSGPLWAEQYYSTIEQIVAND